MANQKLVLLICIVAPPIYLCRLDLIWVNAEFPQFCRQLFGKLPFLLFGLSFLFRIRWDCRSWKYIGQTRLLRKLTRQIVHGRQGFPR
jgi:hypothetical protein